MKLSGLVKNMMMVFTASFTLMIIFTMISGLQYDNEKIVRVLICSIIYALMSFFLFADIYEKRWQFHVAEIVYVLMINVVYMAVLKIGSVELSVRQIGFYTGSSIIVYITIRLVIFGLDVVEARRFNELVKRKKNRKKGK